MANRHRGEIDLDLAGKSYLLRPTFNAIAEMEDRTGKTAYEMIRDVTTKQSAPLKNMAAAFHACIRAGFPADSGRSPSFDEVGAAIRAGGIAVYLPIYLNLLSNMLSSDEQLQQAAKEAEERASGKDRLPTQTPQ